MSLKIFHTGDIHLGMKFNTYAPGVKDSLVEARFTSLENMINKSNELNVDIFVIAGDLFNAIQVLKRDIKRTVKILDKFNGAAVLVLPGNHDYDDTVVDLWRSFTEGLSEKIILLNEKRPYSLKDYDLNVVVYPAPCHNKHSEENNLGWIKDEGLMEEGKYHIGIAHGALEGLSPDVEGNYYQMYMDELNSIAMDLWLLGHTHVRYPLVDEIKDHRVFNAGTPEPDGLNYRYKGSAWLIDLEEERISAKRIITGEYRFYDKEFEIEMDEDLKTIENWVLEGNPAKKIIRLNLKGSISKDAYENLHKFYSDLESQTFHLLIEDGDLKRTINKDIIESEFTKGSFPYEFLNGLAHDEVALQMAYDLLRGE